MINDSNNFEHQEYSIFHNNSIVNFTICKINQEIMIKSNKYEAKLTHQNIENLTNMKFDNIEKEYNYLLNLFQQNSIKIKDILINQSIILTFIQNGKMIEIILLYNNESKSITHYELNFEFKNLQSDIAQIKKDVHDIHSVIHNNNININQNNNNSNKNNIFDYNTTEFDIYNKFMINNTIAVLNKQIINQKNFINELEKKINEYQESARNLLKEGDKENCKKILAKKKAWVEKIKFFEGVAAVIEEQKSILETTKVIHSTFEKIKIGNRANEEAFKGLNVSDLEAMKEEMDNMKNDQEQFNDREHLEEEDNKIEKKEEEKRKRKRMNKRKKKKKKKKKSKTQKMKKNLNNIKKKDIML